MQIKDYVDFTPTTAIYTKENEIPYLTMGLISEVGELCGKVAKLFRGDKTVEGMKEKLVQEAADVFWFVSQLHHISEAINFYQLEEMLEGCYEYGWYEKTTDGEKLRALYSTCKDMQFEAWGFLEEDRIFHPTAQDNAMTILTGAATVCVLLGYTVEEAMDLNYEKLTGRKAAGTIQGDGDGINDRH